MRKPPNPPVILGAELHVPDHEYAELVQRAAHFLRVSGDAIRALVPGNHPAWGHIERAENYMQIRDAVGVLGAAACARATAYAASGRPMAEAMDQASYEIDQALA